MSLITSNSLFQTAASGLEVQKKRLEAAAQNIANSRVSSTPGSIGYQIKSVSSKGPEDTDFLNVFQNQLEGPESIIDGSDSANNLGPTSEIVETAKYRYEYDPSHPDADENGMVQYPDVDMVREMASMVSANRLYEANLSVIEAAKQIMKRSMEI
ncbi:MAG: flagellar basal body rod C-terminal domain-containing protein [Bacteroidota bacterium]|nr:flagellar basal body rod C-terminal domain-containing protein [Bacteroidota bacterium]|tara:strand:+ start:691 stop:1155 length:465 start_codon:yes stop_codon:yes gene_type:complete